MHAALPAARNHPTLTLLARLSAGLLVIGLTACGHTDDASSRSSVAATEESPPSTRAPERPRAERPTVTLTMPGGEPKAVDVEVVRTRRKLRRGLMYRQYMRPDSGMLFLMLRDEQQSFWMRNTLIPLDMIFIGSDMVVRGVIENTTPLTDTKLRIKEPTLYVLEVNGGWCKANGVGAGAQVAFQRVPGYKPRPAAKSAATSDTAAKREVPQ